MKVIKGICLKIKLLLDMKIDFANLNIAYSEHKKEIDLAINDVISNSSFIMGHHVISFEEHLNAFVGVKHSISCSSGTDALLLAMMALNIKPGDEVITTPFSFIATGETIAFLGAIPVFVDIDEKTFNINVNKIEEKITNKTKIILPVSLYGQMSDMNEINKIANKHNIHVIEDGAQSFGSSIDNLKSCNSSLIGCTSFFPAKPLGCYGDGGALFTNNDKLASKIKSLRVHGQSKRYYHKYIGMGGRLDSLQAAILNIKLKYFNEDILRRNNVAKKYNSLLSENFEIPFIKDGYLSVWAQYTINVNNRDILQKKLKKSGIPTSVHYPLPLHLQECFKYLKYKQGDFPIAEKASKTVMSLPMNPYLTNEEVNYICSNLIKYNK